MTTKRQKQLWLPFAPPKEQRRLERVQRHFGGRGRVRRKPLYFTQDEYEKLSRLHLEGER
jgi:hypothetical protein